MWITVCVSARKTGEEAGISSRLFYVQNPECGQICGEAPEQAMEKPGISLCNACELPGISCSSSSLLQEYVHKPWDKSLTNRDKPEMWIRLGKTLRKTAGEVLEKRGRTVDKFSRL
jgi:hypothetical protein